jgi:molecular chaperone Hsp33
MPFTELDRSPLSFKCRCSPLRVMSALATLDRSELLELVKSDTAIEMACDYCGQPFSVSPVELEGLLEQS